MLQLVKGFRISLEPEKQVLNGFTDITLCFADFLEL